LSGGARLEWRKGKEGSKEKIPVNNITEPGKREKIKKGANAKKASLAQRKDFKTCNLCQKKKGGDSDCHRKKRKKEKHHRGKRKNGQKIMEDPGWRAIKVQRAGKKSMQKKNTPVELRRAESKSQERKTEKKKG